MQISLFGATTLNRFTEGILRYGLEGCGCRISRDLSQGSWSIIQLHGSPAAYDADLEMIRDIPDIAARSAACIVLVHRPDEIKDTIPQLSTVLAALPARVGLVMLGDLLIEDPFYQTSNLQRRVIPHGFFDTQVTCMRDPVIIGSHTTWGEMRSVDHALVLLKAVSEVGPREPLLAYLGGIPAETLSHATISAIVDRLELTHVFELRDLHSEVWRDELASVHRNTIFLNAGEPLKNFDVTFNLQLYHYGRRVRMGESSGSLHSSSGIPVVFEMNGAERLENIKTVKVPYRDRDDVNTADYSSAAQQIVKLINSGDYRQLLDHNGEMSRMWSSQCVGRLYVDFLQCLAQSGD